MSSTFWSFFKPRGKKFLVSSLPHYKCVCMLYTMHDMKSMMVSLVWVWRCHIIHQWRNHTRFMQILPNKTRMQPLYKNTSLRILQMWIYIEKLLLKSSKRYYNASQNFVFSSIKVIFNFNVPLRKSANSYVLEIQK